MNQPAGLTASEKLPKKLRKSEWVEEEEEEKKGRRIHSTEKLWGRCKFDIKRAVTKIIILLSEKHVFSTMWMLPKHMAGKSRRCTRAGCFQIKKILLNEFF